MTTGHIQRIGQRWTSTWTLNQFVINVSFVALWTVVFGLSLGVGGDALSPQTSTLWYQLAWALTGAHVTLALHLEKLVFVLWAFGYKQAQEVQDGAGA